MRLEFQVGHTYFSIFYMDEDKHHPVVETLVYLGPDNIDTDTGHAHLFQYAVSYYSDGNWNELTDEERYEFDEPPVIAFDEEGRVHVVDADGLVAELTQWKSRS